jgi:putative ATPase
MGDLFGDAAAEQAARTGPLAHRVRPRSLGELVGQQDVVGPATALGRAIAEGRAPSMILHGPPGVGKTTIARIVAETSSAAFEELSAVSARIDDVRAVIARARDRLGGNGVRTLLFIDEIHRLNKGQQDFLLPWIESGLMTLVGATTEHPGFEINPAVLSRSTVLVLETLTEDDLRSLVRRALQDTERGLGASGVSIDDEAEDILVRNTGGDARQALTGVEIAARLAGPGGRITVREAREALQQPTARYDTSLMYEMLSAFHKSLRGSSGSGALYWAMRMIQSGEDPKTVFRRLIAAAYEDVGLADPQAGIMSVNAMLAFERLGLPEGLLPLYNAILYVANAPKSNRAYMAGGAAAQAAKEHPNAPVPLSLRNPTTSLMKEWGFGEGYKYAHDYPGGYTPLQTLPDEIQDARFYEPTDRGYELKIAARMRERGDPG